MIMETTAKHTQLKISVDPEIESAFKKTSAASNVSMSTVLTQFMTDYSKGLAVVKAKPDYSTRRRRRAAIKGFIKQMEEMKTMEESVLWNTPENLIGSASYDATEEAISSLDEAIDALNEF
jgi:hypothetical protein